MRERGDLDLERDERRDAGDLDLFFDALRESLLFENPDFNLIYIQIVFNNKKISLIKNSFQIIKVTKIILLVFLDDPYILFTYILIFIHLRQTNRII